MSLSAGQRLGPYEIVALVGAGGMGEVYRARDPRLERTVAVKVLPTELAQSDTYRQRFQREAQAASALSHPNIAHIYDVGEQDGTHFIAMEYVEGESLRALVLRGPLDPDRVAEVGIQMASALEEAHARGIVHRDIKSANAVISAQGQVKVLDFGLARQVRDSAALDSGITREAHTQVGVVLGTVPYMSPEQALGEPVDARTDIFSLGVVLYQLATGRLPFAGNTTNQTIDRICHATPEPITELNRKVPEALERIVSKCLEKDRERRYATAKDLQVDLRNLRRDREAGVVTRPPARRARAGRWAAGAALGVLTLALAGLGLQRWLAPGGTAIESIAVLPFQNTTGNADLEYLSVGLTEALINSLAQRPGLKVTSRASALVFKDQQQDLGEIARKLGVRTLLLGRLAQQGNELSLSAELVDARDSRQLWGQRYQMGADVAPKVEDEMVRTISHTLGARLSGEGDVRNTAVDPEAYRLSLKGRMFLAGTPDELQQATALFQQAIERDPLYAAAHAGLAESYAIHAYLLSDDREETVRKARAAVRRALEIAPDLAEALAVSGLIRLYFDWDLPGAEADLKLALEKNPSSAMAYEEYTNVLVAQGQAEQSLAVARRAKELDPLSVLPTHQLGIAYMIQGRFEEAAQEFMEAQQIRPNWLWGYIKRGKALAHLGRCQDALAEAERGEKILGAREHEAAWSWIAFVYATCGREDRAREYLQRMEALERRRFVDPVAFAVIYAALDDEARVLDRLEQAYRARSPQMFFVSGFPRFYSIDRLASNTRFQELCRRVLPSRTPAT